MKLLFVLAAFTALCAASPLGTTPGDNSHYVEGESRYIWMPDGEGVPHLVDLEERTDDVVTRSGANNAYWLFTRNNPNAPQLLVHGDGFSVWNSNYVASRPLVVIVHGWRSDRKSEVNILVRDAMLDVMDANVIVVDWKRQAQAVYWNAANGVPDVGRHLGNFLVWLFGVAGGNWNNVHLVGFSLGAHVVGNAGRTIAAIGPLGGGGNVARITGLDPAGPIFGGNDNALKATDGLHVEAIHTDGGALGIFDPIGEVNFYPNGGRNSQPGCLISTCSHSRAYELFASTVYTNHLVGQRCTNLNEARRNRCSGSPLHMGNNILTKRGTGLYGLSTARRWPF